MAREIKEIAKEIRVVWPKVHYAAEPYLAAMAHLKNMKSMYGVDSADTIVLYFLTNAGTFRGDAARRIKLELKELLKGA